MIIKKFTAQTMTEALGKVREELGTDAIILSTRSEKQGGVFDFMGRRMVEVTAAIDDSGGGGDSSPSSAPAKPSPVSPAEAKLYPPRRPVTYEPSVRPDAGRRTGKVDVRDLESRVDIERMFEDIGDLKRSIKVLADTALTGEMSGLPPNLAKLLAEMKDSGMDDRIAKRIVRQLLDELTGGELGDPEMIKNRAIDLLLAGMGNVSPVIFAGAKPRIVTFVGPTGSGKTTTIAKLAADFTLNMDKKLTVLTIDTKRVDAVGQLKAYCRILNVPLNIAYTPDELPSIMPVVMKSDVTLVDTPGSGPMDRPMMLEMVEFLQKLLPQEVHLVMSATTSLAEMKRIYDNFSVLKPNRILFTKLDETDCYGPLISFTVTTDNSMSYVTFGQNVPGDFAVADPRSLIGENLGKKRETSV
ncbi:MAG: flagellar biosynthesis protein FlhF [Candidatus Latescibacteria bacterium]|nr:flagellar biosynthesis protein FlhF [Candidatus Latescibacterota bacterium]